MKTLGLDCATKTGFAIAKDGLVVQSGVKDFSKKRGESNGIMFLRFRQWLEDTLMEEPRFDMVCYEQAHHRGGAATEVCVNLTGRVQEVCEQYGVEYMPVHSASLKKFATTKGRATKDEMISAINKKLFANPKLGYKTSLITDDNEADACWLALYPLNKGGKRG